MIRKKQPKIETLRHSCAHILAAAVKELFPEAKFGIGPVIENGFYYDFDKIKITPEDLLKIEEKMKEIITQDLKFEKEEWLTKKALEYFKKQNQNYKVELIKELAQKGAKKVRIYKLGPFIDLCKGPHLKSTSQINPAAFKLTKIAGAYWQGDEKNPMLTRIYGIAFYSEKELKEYLTQQEEAKKRDHRILGQKLDLFIFDEEVGAGLPLWLPKGALLRQIIEDFSLKEHLKEGYQILRTPHIARLQLWQTSGHWNFYRENIYSPIEIEEEKYLLKPMNCPFHIKIYQNKIRSYKDLPLKYFELGTVYRYERSGVLHGLTRVRGFTQDDAHIFCTPEQLDKELVKILRFGLKILKIFGFKEYEVYLSTRPEKYVGTLKNWQKATQALKTALNKVKLKYQIDPGEGVFYGPKIDIKIKDSLGRAWQCTTIQVDFNLPERFNVFYIDKKGKKQQPIMIHRALFGSVERFIGVLLEHYAGALPFWLSPEQIWIIPIASRHKKYAQEIYRTLKENNYRVQLKAEKETLNRKIREGQLQKIPYLLIIGDKETKSKTLRPRSYQKGDLGEMKLTEFLKYLEKVSMAN